MAIVTKKGSLEGRRKIENDTRNRKWKKKTDICQEFGLVNSMMKMIWKNRIRIISAVEQNGPGIKQF
jgi:hypothetical protein